jgi:hypothetical protein
VKRERKHRVNGYSIQSMRKVQFKVHVQSVEPAKNVDFENAMHILD